MIDEPLISIIITYYNKKLFIDQTLQSILNQSYKNYEIIFVFDDNNKVDLKYIRKKLSKFKKKKLILNKKNLGAAKSRNIGIKNSRGDYIAFIDSDDKWKKNKLYNQLKFMKNNSLVFSFTSYSLIDEKDKFIKERNVCMDADYESLMKSNYIGLNTVMVSREIKSFLNFPKLRTQEDFALWLRLARKKIKLSHLKTNLSYWRKTKNSLSSNPIHKIIDAFKLYYKYEKKNFLFSIYSVIVLSYNKIHNNYFLKN